MNAIQENILFLKELEKDLLKKRVPAALSEAESLVGYFGRFDRLDFLTGQKGLSLRAKKGVRAALKTRLKGVPLPYILREAYFLGLPFYVTRDTLIPRPETELLAEEALRIMDNTSEVLDVGTGSGCIAAYLTMQKPDCRMTALDISKEALQVARKNIKRHGLEEKIELVHSDLFNAFNVGVRWDIIISNPPYVATEDFSELPKEVLAEPREALNGGPRGLSVIERILDEAPDFLKKDGWLLMEIGKDQAKILEKIILRDSNYKNLRFVKDFAGIKRIVVLQKQSNSAGPAAAAARFLTSVPLSKNKHSASASPPEFYRA